MGKFLVPHPPLNNPPPAHPAAYCCFYARRAKCRYGIGCIFSHNLTRKVGAENLSCDRCQRTHKKYPCKRHSAEGRHAAMLRVFRMRQIGNE